MTQVLEGIGVILDKTGSDKCPICEKDPHPDRTTTDKKEDKGNLKSVPGNLGVAQLVRVPKLPNYATAAHHLIPANQCLKQFPRLTQMCKVVGYDVNNKANGTPLPTCGQKTLNSYVNEDGTAVKYSKLKESDKRNVAFLIMERLNLQWHVGHHDWAMDLTTDTFPHPENYDKLVKLKLRDLEKDAKKNGKTICDPPDDSESGSALIEQLNALSQEIDGHVFAWNKYFVSAWACRFANEYR